MSLPFLDMYFYFIVELVHTCNCLYCAKKPVTIMLTYPWKCTFLHCNHLRNTWKPLVLMTRHFDYNQSVRSSAPMVSRCFPGGYNVKLYISSGRLAWWLLAFLCCALECIWNDWQWVPSRLGTIQPHFDFLVRGVTVQRASILVHWILTLEVLVTTIDEQWQGMGDVGSARYEPALLPPCPTIRVLSYSN